MVTIHSLVTGPSGCFHIPHCSPKVDVVFVFCLHPQIMSVRNRPCSCGNHSQAGWCVPISSWATLSSQYDWMRKIGPLFTYTESWKYAHPIQKGLMGKEESQKWGGGASWSLTESRASSNGISPSKLGIWILSLYWFRGESWWAQLSCFYKQRVLSAFAVFPKML